MEKATFRTLCLFLLLTSTSVFSQGETDFTGTVLYNNNDNPMSGVNAYLHAPGDIIIDTAITDIEGNYTFENVTPGDYKVTFSTEQPAGGVALEDPYLLLLKFSDPDIYPFTDIQKLAADVDGNDTLNLLDYNSILEGYMNQEVPFPIGPWVFETVLTPIPVPSREGFITSRASSSGDVSGSLQPDPKGSPIFLNNPVVNLTADPSDPIEFNLAGGQNLKIAGMHLVIRIPDDLNVISVESPVSAASIFISEGEIRVTWIDRTRQGFEITEGTPLLVIRTKATRLSRNGNSYGLKLGDESHFIDINGELIQGVSLILPTINVKLQKDLAVSAYPNPFLNFSTLDFLLPQDGLVIIALFDQSGRQVMEMENGIRSAGSHQVIIDGAALLPGIYHYSISFSGSDQYINTGTIIKSK